MKGIFTRQELHEAVGAVTTLTGGRTTRPILGCVRLAVAGGQLELGSTDGEAALRVSVPALSADEPGVAVVPADRFSGIIRELDDVEVQIEADDRACTIRGHGSSFKIYVSNPADFPPLPEPAEEPDLTIDGNELRELIRLTIYAAARETSRYAINGVLWEKRGQKLYLVATDGRRLARAGGQRVEGRSGDFEAIVPARSLNVFEKVFTPPRGADDWSVGVQFAPNQVVLQSGPRVLSTVLVEGRFPRYQEVIPTDAERIAKLEREAFLAAVRRAALLTTEESRAVRLAFGEGPLVISSQAPEQGEARVEVPVEYEGDPIEIGFNPLFLQDCLRAIPYDEVVFELKDAFQPGLLRGADRDEFLYVVMPVSLAT